VAARPIAAGLQVLDDQDDPWDAALDDQAAPNAIQDDQDDPPLAIYLNQNQNLTGRVVDLQ
jgi:hypothetical protein